MSPAHAPNLKLFLALTVLAAAQLACFTSKKTVIFQPDGSGLVSSAAAFPQALGAGIPRAEIAQSLAAEGWTNVSFTTRLNDSPGCALSAEQQTAASGVLESVRADYPFDLFSPDTMGAAVTEFSAVEFTAVDQSDGSVVYSFAATADVTEIQEAWHEAVNVWAVEGLDLAEVEAGGSGALAGLLAGAGTFTGEQVQAMIAAYGEPLVEVVIVLPGQVTQAAVGWTNSEELLAGASDSARFTWCPGDPAVTELSLVRVARPPSPDGAGEPPPLDPDALFEFSMALPWSVPALDSLTPGQIAEAALAGNAPPSSLTQLATLRVLDTARRSGDPAVYNQLDGLAYAPIRLSGADHRAVVVFPSGTDWRSTGVVLDPWIAAFPAGVPVEAWAGSIWVGEAAAAPEIDPILGDYYPHAGGGDPVYPPDVQLDDALPPPPAAAYTRSLFARGPVSVLVILPDGRHIGETPGGGLTNHLRGEAEMFKRPGEAGLFDWWTFLPETGYRVEIHALAAGALQVAVGGSGFDIADLRPGELLAFTVAADGTPGPVERSGGEPIADPGLESEAQPIPGVPESPEEPGNQGPAGSYPLIGGFACMVVLGLALMIVSGIGLSRRRRVG